MQGIEIRFLGHASFRLTGREGEVIYFDPWLDDKPACQTTLADISAADIVCVARACRSPGRRDRAGEDDRRQADRKPGGVRLRGQI